MCSSFTITLFAFRRNEDHRYIFTGLTQRPGAFSLAFPTGDTASLEKREIDIPSVKSNAFHLTHSRHFKWTYPRKETMVSIGS